MTANNLVTYWAYWNIKSKSSEEVPYIYFEFSSIWIKLSRIIRLCKINEKSLKIDWIACKTILNVICSHQCVLHFVHIWPTWLFHYLFNSICRTFIALQGNCPLTLQFSFKDNSIYSCHLLSQDTQVYRTYNTIIVL